MQICSKSTKCFLNFLNVKERKLLIESNFLANFVYCSLVWVSTSAKFLNKVESIPEKSSALTDFTSSDEQLLEKSGKSKIYTYMLRTNTLYWVFQIISKQNINPIFMSDFFSVRLTKIPIRKPYKNIIELRNFNQVKFGKNILGVYGPKVFFF